MWRRKWEIDLNKSEEHKVSLTLLAAGDFCILKVEGTGSFPPDYTQDNATDMKPSDVTNHYTVFTVLQGLCYMFNFIWSISWINFSYIILFAVGSHDNPQKSLCMSVGCGSVVPCRHQPDRQAHCVWHSCWPLTFLFPLRICVDVSRRYVFYQFVYLK